MSDNLEFLKHKRHMPPPDPAEAKENITLTAREILEKKIDEAIAEYPKALKAKHVEEIMNCTQPQLNKLLNNNKIPGAKKIPGLSWRIPREPFFAWWFGNGKEAT